MNHLTYFSIVTPPELTRRSSLPWCFVFITMLIPWLVFLPMARAVDPPPDGGYPNGNTAEGNNALFSVTTGYFDTAVGSEALYFNSTGYNNTAIGYRALVNNTTGSGNTANGSIALYYNTTGNYNTADGTDALGNNTTGSFNTASGLEALFFNTTGNYNTAYGFALHQNTTGSNNTATGHQALLYNTTGDSNTAVGYNALLRNTTGANNIAVGVNAGLALTTGSNNIAIGAGGSAGESNTIRIGRSGLQKTTYIQGIYGATVASGVEISVDTSGRLGTRTSSSRFKEAIKPMDKASEAILALQPVTFRYKHELDPHATPQFGLVAEEVEKVNPELVAHDEQGKPYTVRYEAVNAMLLNEFLKEHRKVEQQQATIARLESNAAQQQKQIEALTATVQKVSDQMALSKSAAQLVTNP